MPQLQAPFRRATPTDAAVLAELVNFASEGLALHLWSKIAGPAGDAWAVGRERALRLFDWDRSAEQFEQIYFELGARAHR